MATTVSSKPTGTSKKVASSVGAPSQLKQSSRKGKRAWRKNVDIEDIEEGLEGLRTEERVVGTTLQKKTNEELFEIDVKGDAQIRRSLPRFSTSLLTSTKILAQRSAVPAVFAKSTGSSAKRKKLSHEEKDRLLRMGKRMRKGPFNGVMDPTEMGAGSAMLEVSEAAKQSGQYDVWGVQDDAEATEQPDSSKKLKVKAPSTPHPRSLISLSAVPSPHEGTSYNPPAASHRELLLTAHEIEERRAQEAEKVARMKEKIEQMRAAVHAGNTDGLPPGMAVDELHAEQETETKEDEPMLAKKMPERKTKKERQKADKIRAEKRALADKIAQKRMLTSVFMAKSIRKSATQRQAERERIRTAQQQAMAEKVKKGLAGQRLGKHTVAEGEIDVQLGEELTDNLRGLKPEGNLFRDRFLNMQQRALIEPRVPVIPKKRKMKFKEHEKHSFKKFDREQE